MRKKQIDDAAGEPAAAKQLPALVKMTRDEPQSPGGPVTADVHPAEVENMKAHGWRVAG